MRKLIPICQKRLIGLALGSLLFAVGCGGGAPPRQTYVYVGQLNVEAINFGQTGSVAQFRMENDGSLTALSLPAPGSFLPYFQAVDPLSRHLFAFDTGVQQLREFQIENGGTLTEETSVVSDGDSITFTPDGQFAFITAPDNRTLTSYGLGSNGMTQIGAVATSPSPSLNEISSTVAVVDPSGRFAYVNDMVDNTVLGYAISATGTLTPIGSFPGGGQYLRAIVISPLGFLYCINENSRTVTTLSLNPQTGALTLMPNQLATGVMWLSLDPSGRYAYIGGTTEIQQYTVDASTGALISNGVTPAAFPSWAGIDPSGRFLFASTDDGTVAQFIIDGNGMLVPNGSAPLLKGTVGQEISFAQR